MSYRFWKGTVRLAVVGVSVLLAFAMASCREGRNREAEAVSRAFPESLERLLQVAIDGQSAVRFSRTGRATTAVAQASIPGFGPPHRLVHRARLASEAERDLEHLSDLERLHALGVYHAVEGDLDRALIELEGAALHQTDDAAVWADRSAVHLLRHSAEKDPRDLFDALRYADRALAIDSLDASAAFNRAEVLTRMTMVGAGVGAWDRFLELEPTGEWTTLAEQRRATLTVESVEKHWELGQRILRSNWASRREVPDSVVAAFPQRSRMWLLAEVLPAWARALQQGETETATDHLDLARAIAPRLTVTTQDHLLADTITAIDRQIRDADSAAFDDLLEGVTIFGAGIDAYESQAFESARRDLSRAAVILRELEVPIWGVAAFYPVAIEHHGDSLRAVGEFGEIINGLPIDRYPQLHGFCELMLGSIEAVTGNAEAALQFFEQARVKLDRSAPDVVATVVYPSLGDARRLLGRDEEAFATYLEGARASALSGDRKRYGVALYTLSEALLEHGDAEVALTIGDEMVENAAGSTLPSVRAEAYLQRGRARLALELEEEGVADLQAAYDAASRIDGEAHRQRIQIAVDLATAELLVRSSPGAALATLDALIDQRLVKGYLYRLPRVLVARSRAYGALGDDARREGDLEAAIVHVERLRSEATEPANRRSVYSQAMTVYEEMIRHQLDDRSSPESAFEYAERGRARGLGEGLRVGASAYRPFRLTEIQARLHPDVALIEYAVLADRVLVWMVSRRDFEMREISIGRDEVVEMIERLSNSLRRKAPVAVIRQQSGDLYDLLVGQIRDSVPTDASLLLVPDSTLRDLSFGVLYDRASGRYLPETHEVAISPSATVHVAAAERAQSHPWPPTSALAVGNPSFSARHHPSLERLPEANGEALAVGKAFPGGRVLTGRSATRAAVVEELPRYAVAYFATHAVIDPAVPERSALLLAEEDGEATELTAAEIRTLDLGGVALVVLSVCAPIQGEESGSEVLTGLIAAFLEAGVSTVVAPTRPVSGESTAWLVGFVQEVSAGAAASAAFRKAGNRAIVGLHPEEWSVFQLIGAPRTLRREP